MKDSVMSSNGRRSAILQLLKQNSNISVTELSKKFNVSEVTIRKDLNLLKERNLLVRTRGGAILHETPKDDNDMSIRFKKLANYREKQAIGRMAASLIKSNMTTVKDLLKDIFDGLTDEEIKRTKVREVARVLVDVVKFTITQLKTGESKN